VSALRRGRQGIEGVVDLHGLRQSEAHQVLRGFLHRSQAAGLKVVLVITGKGGAPTDDSPFGERGVLRRMVPHWLRLPDLRPVVVGFEEAAAHHGGGGALYVRLRRSTRGERE
jgi:DNA-nicking Smr family endonuclease